MSGSVMQRLDRLERENRRLKRGGVAALAVIAAVVLMGQAIPSKVVEAEQFILRDAKGVQRAALAAGSEGPVVFFLAHRDGKPRASLLVKESGNPGLSLFDKDGKTLRAAVAVLADGTAGLTIYDTTGNAGVIMGSIPGGKIGVAITDRAGRTIWGAP